jgi:hypothetical protein
MALLIHQKQKLLSVQWASYDGRIKPDVMAQGVSAVLSNQFGNIVTANGTSFLVYHGWYVASFGRHSHENK